mmetsp:Transcript_9795/g.14713  ORF Transcript_9795/g.14713 Transcript_9795/m.14713 type:complete len:592 (+) Transcript_9795:79-1854(+)
MVLKTVTTFLTTTPVRGTRTYEYKNILVNVCFFILIMEMCERLCYYGLTGSIKVLFQSRFNYSSFQASALTNVLPSFVYITPLLGGYVADEIWGRFKTITLFGFIYLAGVILMSISVKPGSVNKTLFMFSCFGLLALGAGGIKANVVTLGGDQFGNSAEHQKQKEQFFNYFYWAINIGAGISYGYLAQMATNGSGDISEEYGFFWSFMICTIALGLALITFLSASGRYILLPASGGTMGTFFNVFKNSLRTSWEAWGIVLGGILMACGFVLNVGAAFIEDKDVNKQVSIAGCVTAGVGVLLSGILCVDISWVGNEEENATQLDRKGTDSNSPLSAQSTGNPVKSAKELWRVIPAVLCATSFWVAYNQMSSNFYAQSCQMNLLLGGSTQLNAAVLNVGDCIAIVVCIPLFDSFLYPFIERCKGSKFTVLQKMACGFIVTCIALVAAALIEIERRKSGVVSFESDGKSYSNCAPVYSESNPDTCEEDSSGFIGKKTCMSNLSVFWMAIPYFLIGVGECLISVQVYELCYTEIPVEMRSTAQAINLFTTGLASAIAAGLTVAFQNDIPNDLNKGRLEVRTFMEMTIFKLGLGPY